MTDYRPPPDGWYEFGYHAPCTQVPPLEFSAETDDCGLPRWERLVEPGSGEAVSPFPRS